MKNLLIFIFICFGFWKYFLKDYVVIQPSNNSTITALSNSDASQTLANAKDISKAKSNFQCDGRQYCSQMSSYQEAKYFIQHCPNTKMDGDNDGIPCETQFKK